MVLPMEESSPRRGKARPSPRGVHGTPGPRSPDGRKPMRSAEGRGRLYHLQNNLKKGLRSYVDGFSFTQYFASFDANELHLFMS